VVAAVGDPMSRCRLVCCWPAAEGRAPVLPPRHQMAAVLALALAWHQLACGRNCGPGRPGPLTAWWRGAKPATWKLFAEANRAIAGRWSPWPLPAACVSVLAAAPPLSRLQAWLMSRRGGCRRLASSGN